MNKAERQYKKWADYHPKRTNREMTEKEVFLDGYSFGYGHVNEEMRKRVEQDFADEIRETKDESNRLANENRELRDFIGEIAIYYKSSPLGYEAAKVLGWPLDSKETKVGEAA